jgi:phage major head subunit gpT-like protein
MDLTPANLRALRTTFSKDFRDAYGTTEVWYPKLSTTVRSSSTQNDYGWMADLPQVREWLGSRVVNNLITQSYTLKNKTYESTLGVPREAIEDDNLGIYSEVSAAHGEAFRKHPDVLHTVLLKDGESNLCFDGQNYFDTDHPVNGKDASLGTYSNYNASGKALTQDNFLAQRAVMMGYLGEGGRPLGVRPNLLVVPPALEGTAISIVKNEFFTAGISNTTRGMAEILVIEELAGEDTAWYLVDARKRIKPFVFQLRRPVSFVTKNRIDDDVVLEENEFRMYADARYNAGYTLPFLAQKNVA